MSGDTLPRALGAPAMGWIASNQLKLTALDPQREWITPAFQPGIYTGSGGGDPNAALIITIPAGQISAKAMTGSCLIFEPGYAGIGFCSVGSSGNVIVIQKPNLSNFALSTDNTTVRGQITFEVV